MSDSSSYIPASQDLEVLEVASVLMGNEYNRAPKSQQEAVEQAHAVLAEHFKITQTSAWDDLQNWMGNSIFYYTRLKTSTSVSQYIPEDPAVVDAFVLKNLGLGPVYAEGALKFDFRNDAPFESGWNLLCVNIITAHTLAALDSAPATLQPALPAVPEVYIRSATIHKMRAFRKIYVRG